jgi:hypothetical protein
MPYYAHAVTYPLTRRRKERGKEKEVYPKRGRSQDRDLTL